MFECGLSLFRFVKRGVECVEISAVKMILRDAKGIGEFCLLNKGELLLLVFIFLCRNIIYREGFL